MQNDWLVNVTERYGWILIATTGIAAVFLFYVGVSEGMEEHRSFWPILPTSGWSHSLRIGAACGAFVVCLAALLIGVTAEDRRMRGLRNSVVWTASESSGNSRQIRREAVPETSGRGRRDRERSAAKSRTAGGDRVS